MVMAINYKK